MNEWILLATNVGIASFIGGLTNELAIRMLFRPYKPWMIGKFRVPFTPGLIPRRHHELGQQMGKVVEEYLLTKEGIREAVSRGQLEETLRSWLAAIADKWLNNGEPLQDVINRLFPDTISETGGLHDRIRLPLKHVWMQETDKLLAKWEDKTIRELLPESLLVKLDETISRLGEQLLDKFRDYLESPEGVHNIQNMIKSALGGGGGMFGGLVGMFLGDEKLVQKILPHLQEALRHPDLAKNLSRMIRQEADKLLGKQTGDVVEWIGRAQIDEWRMSLFDKLEGIGLRWLQKPVSETLGRFREQLVVQAIPWITGWTILKLEQSIEHLFPKLAIAEIVAKQVDSFPLRRVEEMIIGISGKEFRMITILGFILGGIIGLVQGVLNMVVS